MKETIIQNQLENLFPNSDLEFQVVYEVPYLKVAINYYSTLSCDRTTLMQRIQKTLSELNLPDNIQYIALYTRPINQTEPDWSTCIRVFTSKHSQEANRHEPSVSQKNNRFEKEVVTAEEKKSSFSKSSLPKQSHNSNYSKTAETETLPNEQFSNYCFIRNQSLLTQEIVAPPLQVAELVTSFHKLSASEKQQLLPMMSQLLEQKTPEEIEKVSAQKWIEDVFAFNEEYLRKAKIWLSRYCYDPKETIATLENTINQSEEPAVQEVTEDNATPRPRISDRVKKEVKNEAERNKNIKIYENADRLIIVAKWQDPHIYFITGFNIIYFIFILQIQPSPLFIFMMIGLIITYWTMAKWLNRTYIFANYKGLMIYHKPIPWLGSGKRIKIKNLEKLYIKMKVTVQNERTSDIDYEICANTYRRAEKTLFVPNNWEDAFLIVKTLENYFNIGEIGGPEIITEYHRREAFKDDDIHGRGDGIHGGGGSNNSGGSDGGCGGDGGGGDGGC